MKQKGKASLRGISPDSGRGASSTAALSNQDVAQPVKKDEKKQYSAFPSPKSFSLAALPTTLTPAFLQMPLQDLRRRVAAVILPSLEVQNSWVTAGSSPSSTAEIKQQEGWIFVPL